MMIDWHQDIRDAVRGYVTVFGAAEAQRIIEEAGAQWIWAHGSAEAAEFASDLLADAQW